MATRRKPRSVNLPSVVRGSITTERLILRRWRESDCEPFARLNDDVRVMEYMPHVLSREESDALADRIEAHFRQHGFGLCAVEHRRDGNFIGFIGLSVPKFVAPFTPCVEVGLRLAAEYWGLGLATEGARAIVRHGFETLGLDELVSFTAPGNTRSRRVMEKLRNDARPKRRFRPSSTAGGTSPAAACIVPASAVGLESLPNSGCGGSSMNGRNNAARILVALGAMVLIAGALLHCMAAYPKVSTAVSASNLGAPLQRALRIVFLLVGWDWIMIAIIMLISTFTVTRLRKVIVLLCGFALLVTAAVMLAFLGWFVGTDIVLASALMSFCGGLLFHNTAG